MRTTRILFGDDETPASVASRIVYAFNVGNILKIRDKFFKVTGFRSVVVIPPPEGDNYILILPPGAPEPPKPEPRVTSPEVLLPPPIVTEEPQGNELEEEEPESEPEPEPLPEPVQEPEKAPELPSPVLEPPKSPPPLDPLPELPKPPKAIGNPIPGQRWKAKDTRRSGTFLIVKVDSEYMYSDEGRKISLTRLNRYEKV